MMDEDRPSRRKREYQLYDMVPWDYARRRWQEGIARAPEDYRDSRPPTPAPQDNRVRCSICRWPAGVRGFVRMPFPPGHELFARCICCPDCWPAPFGHAKRGSLSKAAEDLARKWRPVMAGMADA